MPKSKNKRKNGRAKGSNWNQRIAKDNQRRQAEKDAVVAMITQQMLG
jgi:hypothetical protein